MAEQIEGPEPTFRPLRPAGNGRRCWWTRWMGCCDPRMKQRSPVTWPPAPPARRCSSKFGEAGNGWNSWPPSRRFRRICWTRFWSKPATANRIPRNWLPRADRQQPRRHRKCAHHGSGLATPRICRPDAAFCRTSAADDRSHGILLDRAHAEHDRSALQQHQDGRSKADRSAFA